MKRSIDHRSGSGKVSGRVLVLVLALTGATGAAAQSLGAAGTEVLVRRHPEWIGVIGCCAIIALARSRRRFPS